MEKKITFHPITLFMSYVRYWFLYLIHKLIFDLALQGQRHIFIYICFCRAYVSWKRLNKKILSTAHWIHFKIWDDPINLYFPPLPFKAKITSLVYLLYIEHIAQRLILTDFGSATYYTISTLTYLNFIWILTLPFKVKGKKFDTCSFRAYIAIKCHDKDIFIN